MPDDSSAEIRSYFLLHYVIARADHIDCSGIERVLDVDRVIFLDHADARATVLSDLIDVGSLHQPHADIRVPQAVSRTRSAVSVNAKVLLLKDGLEEFALPFWENEVCRFGRAPFLAPGIRIVRHYGGTQALNTPRAEPTSKSLKWGHCTGHTFAISEPAFSAHFNLENRLTQTLIVNDLDITELKAPCFIGPQSGAACEEDKIM